MNFDDVKTVLTLFSPAISLIVAYGAARYAAGKSETRLAHLEKTFESTNATLHDRVTKTQMETNKKLDTLDDRTISIGQQISRLEGVMLGREK